jgi:hypothetical protein
MVMYSRENSEMTRGMASVHCSSKRHKSFTLGIGRIARGLAWVSSLNIIHILITMKVILRIISLMALDS